MLDLGMNSLVPGLVRTRHQEVRHLDPMCELPVLCSKIGPFGAPRMGISSTGKLNNVECVAALNFLPYYGHFSYFPVLLPGNDCVCHGNNGATGSALR